MQKTGNTILVTGGGSGIGEALAHRWHDAGNVVIVTGRRQDMLDKAIAGRNNMAGHVLDVDDDRQVAAFFKEITARYPRLNVLVNNAGVFSLEEITSKRNIDGARKMIDTNVMGPIRMIDAFIDHLSRQPHAAVINVSSGLAFVPFPASPTYGATKAALHSYTMAIRPLLKDKVEVIEIVPPQVQTELTPGQSSDPAGMPLDAFADEVMGLLYADITPEEVCVQRVLYFREAESKGQLGEALKTMLPS